MTRVMIAVLLALPVVLRGQSSKGTCASPFQVALASERHISMHLRAADVEIAGTNKPALRVTCRVDEGDADHIKVSFAAADLRIYGGPDRNLHFRIEVPARTNLLVRLTAGDLQVSGITGDKDIQLRAGDLTIAVGHPEDYRVAEGSVLAGDLNASAFGVTKDGLFRSFRKDNANGRYRLHAELLAGDLTLR
jgi:hypothetical protein